MMEMRKLMRAVSEWLSQGEDVVLATIIAGSGSTPRGAGARMAIINDGSFTGTIGGGAVEYKAQQIAMEALKSKTSRIKSFILSPNDKEGLGMVCGGNVTVYIQYISASDKEVQSLFTLGANLFGENADSWLITDITDESKWHMNIYTPSAKSESYLHNTLQKSGLFTNSSVLMEVSGRRYYAEPLTRAGKVYIFGGGHVSQELVPLLSHLGFSCVVFDNLQAFACKELFPAADEIIVGDFDNISASIDISRNDYVVIMTRGHSFDFAVQAQAMRRNPYYIGVIGSKTKIAKISQMLLEQGFSQEELDSIYTPIGINIKADTPAEIAVSIAAELIMIRAQKRITSP
ncbi:MAG: XdhC family protein [Clostridiales bacterium]|nr:XdhC family protein [Clostridiales bacterium]